MNILLTGGSGGIGSELGTQLLQAGHTLYLPVRNVEKTQEIYKDYSNVYIEHRDLENYDSMTEYCLDRAKEGVSFDLVLILAGDLRRDTNPMFAGNTKEEKEKNSIIYHELANVRTAETVIFGLKKAFGGTLSNTRVLGVSSWAAHFEVGHPYRENEEGYVRAKALLSKLLLGWKQEGVFEEVICEEPALIVSPMTEREFPELIADPEVPKLQPEEYVLHIRKLLKI
jgi:NADP-dependent 3-hydroxy acid dehydrogenase YdfG